MGEFAFYDTMDELLGKGGAQPGCDATQVYAGPFPLLDHGGKAELVSAVVHRVEVGDDTYATVTVCRLVEGAPQWGIYCGDKQLSGEYRKEGKALAAQLRAEGKASNALCNALEASAWVAKVPDQAQCAFFRMQKAGGRYCSHTKHVLSQLEVSQLEQMATDLVSWSEGAGVTEEVAAGVALSQEEEAFYDAAFIQHVMLLGERGSGKTFLARSAADKFDAVYLEMQCHPAMEPWEFRAHDRAWNGKVYTVLGKLAEAVYWIQQGKKVVLCMDEFLNLNPMYATTINTPLSLTDRETYLIETGRIIDQGDGIGIPETVEVPADKLWVVATSNVGARYGLDKIAPSVRARFLLILMNTNTERTTRIVKAQLAKYEMPEEFADMFEKFITAANQAALENTLDEEATTRLACNVLRAVHLKAKRDGKQYTKLSQWLPVVRRQVEREIAQVVNFETGPLDPEQEHLFKQLVSTCFQPRSQARCAR